MKTSASGRMLIEQREGRRLTAYLDSRGIWTIGVGHAATGLPPRPYAGMTITEVECDDILAADLAPVEATIAKALTVPIGQNEFDALASLGFNIGIGGLARSLVVRRLDAGDIEGAAAAFMDWCKPGSLTGRRNAERAQFLTPDAPDASGISPSRHVANARASTIAARAHATKARAKTTTTGGAIVVAGGAAATAAVHAAHHSHLALIIAIIVVVGAAIDALVALARHATANELATNATTQAAVAGILKTPPERFAAPTTPTLQKT